MGPHRPIGTIHYRNIYVTYAQKIYSISKNRTIGYRCLGYRNKIRDQKKLTAFELADVIVIMIYEMTKVISHEIQKNIR